MFKAINLVLLSILLCTCSLGKKVKTTSHQPYELSQLLDDINKFRYHLTQNKDLTNLPFPYQDLAAIAASYSQYDVEAVKQGVERLLPVCEQFDQQAQAYWSLLYLQAMKMNHGLIGDVIKTDCLHENALNSPPYKKLAIHLEQSSPMQIDGLQSVEYLVDVNTAVPNESVGLQAYYVFPIFVSNKMRLATIDTGAELSIIGEAFLEEPFVEHTNLSLNVSKFTETGIEPVYVIDNISVGESTFRNIQAHSGSISGLMLGQNIFGHYSGIAISDKKIKFHTKHNNLLPDAYSVPMYYMNKYFCIFVQDKYGWILANIDTGYSGQTVINPKFSRERLSNDKRKVININYGEKKDDKIGWIDLQLGDIQLKNIMAPYNSYQSSPESDIALTLGSAFFYKYFSHYAFDFKSMRFYFRLRSEYAVAQKSMQK